MEKETLEFLKKLKNNNNKPWFDAHRKEYEIAKEDMRKSVEKIIFSIVQFDKSISGQEAKKCMFRINRDVRFSKNKSPYKNNFGASISEGGKKSFSPVYYLHIQPGNSFVAGGMYMPQPPQLNAVRQEIDYNTKEFLALLKDKNFKKYFSGLSDEDKLKNPPRGYTADNPVIEILKNKNFIVLHKLTDEKILAKNFIQATTEICKSISPLHQFLKRAIDGIENTSV
ncbi:MAG: DUF2461 domain-containing protein [Bacteroidia bacterium]